MRSRSRAYRNTAARDEVGRACFGSGLECPPMEVAGKEGYRHILASSVVFESLSHAALDHISTRGLLVEMQPGEPVLAEGTRGPGLYVVLEGLVEVFLPDGPSADRKSTRLNSS